ncbi:hypothetical protein [Vibrio furnissii]|uniref:hypothetical protein n=1 Tax=Vibrio furnissii TaxID=29494 RepID=UPI001C9D5FF8|nr:hypothetical protein [Vibrio furnissii]MBY7822145.1 hypothetical protein [Vibrio fluvialis]WJG20664.1 hypothetical protein QSU95_10110 [Vibrio furnissii]
MTTLVAWVACDGSKQASVYLASDSRLSWEDKGHWDLGRKIFPSEKYPDILGYCGEALFCSQQLSQIITYIDSCRTFEGCKDPDTRSQMIYDLIKRSFGPYPKAFSLPNFSVVYLTRREKFSFCAYVIRWSLKNSWSIENLSVGNQSSLIIADGSGAGEYKVLHSSEVAISDFGTNSRSYFYALNRFIKRGIDAATGGSPQVACLYNVGAAQKVGVVFNRERYIYGLNIPASEYVNDVRWVNETLENCSGIEMQRLLSAQPQPIPTKLLG